MKRLILILFFLISATPGIAQFYPVKYRPDISWSQLETSHFKIVFPAGEDSAALQTGHLLESHYSPIQDLVGGSLSGFPVILNNYNDISNGIVSPVNFRSEIMLSPNKGKTMNPRTGSWLETVVPHELVHALHLNHINGFSSGSINLVAPDLARSLHTAVPLGVLEGVATYYESAGVAQGGGRGNHPFFYNQFNATFDSPGQWSMGQMLSFPDFTRPFDRHYQGGYEFTRWLQEAYGDSTTKEAIDFYIRWPILGYGVALKKVTGHWPGQLYGQFEESKSQTKEQQPGNDYEIYSPLEISRDGGEIRNPKWLSEHRLIMFGSFYNGRPGFYTYDLEKKSLALVKETFSVSDFIYDLSEDKSRLLFSNYRPDPIHDQNFTAKLYETEISSGHTNRLTSGKSVYAPRYDGGRVYALQSHHSTNRLVSIDDKEKLQVLSSPPETEIVNLAANPTNPEKWAVVANKRGLQGLWVVDSPKRISEELRKAPTISFTGGAVYDPSWHPSGNRLLFTSDHTGIMNIYEYRFDESRVVQVTNAAYNAMEASYGIEGDKISFVVQQKNERLPAVISRPDFHNVAVSDSLWRGSSEKEGRMSRPLPSEETDISTENWSSSSYSSGLSWLPPRIILPVFEEVPNTDIYKVGLSFHSNDLLQQNTYSLEATGLQDRFWYELDYRHTGFYPGFDISLYNRPSFPVFQFNLAPDSVANRQLLQQERGASVGIPFNVTLEQNTRFSALSITPKMRYSGFRYFELRNPSAAISETAHLLNANIFTAFYYKLQQNIRDVQPNAGIVLFSELQHYLESDVIGLNTLGEEFSLSFARPTALQGGIFGFLSPFRQWNHSLRIGVQGLTQDHLLFSTQGIVSNGFSDPVFLGSNNLLSLDTRYTLPLITVDDGGFLLPLYLSNIYLVLFSDSVVNLDRPAFNDLPAHSRTVFGSGIRFRFRISNLPIDLGIAVGFEPSRKNVNIFAGEF